jgi:hypothetical protein
VTTYAAKTTVSSEQSRSEIERTLTRYGATKFMYGWDEQGAVIMFEAMARRIKFVLPLPNPQDEKFTHYYRGTTYKTKHPRTAESAQKEYEQATRQRWRALALVIKAKLEAVESGITSFEDEFLAHTMLPDGTTVAQWARPQIAQVYELNTMPALLPGASS